ncbi:MAG: response regulator, partial [Candidatus Thermoplasmatota archaeon]|nr:response regulator [Candidatus Thermoplasmatota archaeon]
PRLHGHDVLAALQNEGDLATLPVVVFSTSEADRDIDLAYELGARAFLSKPVDLDEFMTTMESLVSFWLKTARLPEAAR